MTERHPPRHLRLAALAALVAAALPAQQATPLVTLSVRDESLGNLLQALSVQHRISVVAGDRLDAKVSINLYDVPLEEALAQVLATQGLAFVKQGSAYRVVTPEQHKAALLAADPLETRVVVLDHLTAGQAQKLLQPLLSADGKLTMADETSTSTGGSGSSTTTTTGQRQAIVVQDHASVLAGLMAAIERLDQPPQQVLLEATILSIDLGEDNRLGVDLNVLGGIDFNQLGPVSDLTGIGDYLATGAQFDDHLVSGRTFGFANPVTQGLSLGYIQNNVAAFVEALEQTTNATIVSNPRVVALNGEQAEIIVGGRLGYSTVVQNQTSSIEQIDFLETGTQLEFRPFIGEDGWIRMEVHPQNSAGVIDPVSGIPSESTTEITTKILMRDGQTLILGGLIGESVSTVRTQIPLLGSLPLLGWLFGRTVETVSRRELVILLTPHVLDPVESARRADATRARYAAARRSQWDSLSPYVRPVMARRHLADAQVLRAQGDLDGALGACERALSLNPTEADAAVLREELLQDLALQNLPGGDAAASLLVLKSLRTGGMR
ncbi:MAG: secretin and TonB N-terminal domain-containing protein [Planctomycetes bacterium]|nr:secretin and TonB N-terminal domain-containing protein [Planctomycetota bacterium]